jgi:hypothetical protein
MGQEEHERRESTSLITAPFPPLAEASENVSLLE